MRRFIKALGHSRLVSARRRYGADEGDTARARNHWAEAIQHYERYLTKVPRDIGVRVRHANTLRESGDLTGAIEAFRFAITQRPGKASLYLALADVLDEAGVLAEAETVRRSAALLVGAASDGVLPGQADEAPPVPPAPPSFDQPARIIIDTSGATYRALQKTLGSLEALEITNWRVSVRGDPDSHLTSAGSAPASDRNTSSSDYPVLWLRAGVVLHPQALGWLRWALDHGASAAYSDHAILADDGRKTTIPQAAPHYLDLLTNPEPPLAVMVSADLYGEGQMPATIGCGLERAFQAGGVMHVPLTLAERAVDLSPWRLNLPPRAERSGIEGRILVVIPTRNEGASLEVMLRSVLDRAADAASIDIVVVDNGSDEPETIERLDQWSGRGLMEVLRCDEPFNWSRLNNLACRERDQPIIVFANNDMEMLSDNWDLDIRRLLNLEGVGAVGARLLYPNGRVQHAGIVMGALHGEPLHEGLRASADEAGPLDRWIRTRPATAVTGAFLAVRRSVFDSIGGFDEAFAVACNDVDFCLRVDEAGWTILYAPELQLRHHESLSRGRADTDAKQRAAAEEMARLLDRWGQRAAFDPTRNPQWEGRNVRLFARCRPLSSEDSQAWAIRTRSRAPNQPETPTFA